MHTWCWCPYKMLYCQYKAQHQMQSTATQITTGGAAMKRQQSGNLEISLISTLLNTNCFGVCMWMPPGLFSSYQLKQRQATWKIMTFSNPEHISGNIDAILRLYHIHCCLIIHMRPHFTKRLQREIKKVYKGSVKTKSNILTPVNPLFGQSLLIQQMHYIE